MKSEEQIQERIEQLEQRDAVTGSPEHGRIMGKIQALQWVLDNGN